MVVLNPTHKQLAERHVAEGRRIVERQRQLIAKVKACNGYSVQAEELLSLFEKSLVIFEYDLARVSKQADGAQAPLIAESAVQTRDV
jgi:hypothetical protein